MTRTDEILAWVELRREFFDHWLAGSLKLHWGDAPGFHAELTKSERVVPHGNNRKETVR